MDFHLPELGEGVYEAEMTRWLVNPGDEVQPGQVLLEVLTDKASMDVPAPFAGTIENLAVKDGDALKVGQVILTYKEKKARAVAEKPATAASKSTAAAVKSGNGPPRSLRARSGVAADRIPVKAAPSVRLLARKLGIDLAQVRGSGPAGRILVDDVAALVNTSPTRERGTVSANPTRERGVLKPPMDLGKPGTRVKLQGVRRVIAEHMVKSKHTIPHYTYVDECDVTEMVKLREALREPYGRQNVKLTYLAFFVKAAAAALGEVPLVNASLDEEAGEIALHDAYHIGIAVATPSGLIVPVIRDADKLSLLETAREIDRLSERARTGKVSLDELRGGTFTVTSIGNLGGLFATPIIAHPQVGILGVGKIVKRPVFDEEAQVRPADMVYLSLSFDHRVLDGAVATQFGNALMQRLQKPVELLVS
ncbi:MAG: 2-oxo acid dehydrogenase subunit E2 [Gemmataceae bacterium]|nr:2-oxo acid dehydrogenase subunit E2 [Gemmataceae bacterium]MCI0737603.1 2-oxo acid dehydrogenase subunit E2 [Gemmataceae bacterium]